MAMGKVLLMACITLCVTMVTGQGYKPGKCPSDVVRYDSDTIFCPDKTCDADQDCAGEQLCCSNGCSMTCVGPIDDVFAEDKALKTVLTCEGVEVDLSCGRDSNIKILSAFWGRGRSNVCTGDLADAADDVRCSGSDAADIVSSMCDGYQECSIPASVGRFGNPCTNATRKYLRVMYTCKAVQIRAELCESTGKLPIYCPDNKVIVPESVFYGAADNYTCFNATKDKAQPRCSETNAFDIIWNYCYGRTTCDLDADPAHFASPCKNRTAYLKMSYTCAECVNSYGDDAQCDLWGLQGDCVGQNTNWMMANCRKTCSKCSNEPPVCTNVHSNDTACELWAAEGQCSGTDGAWMTVYCRRSCMRCDALTDCSKDKYDLTTGRTNCTKWAQNNECSRNMYFMFSNCTKSCFGCHTDKVVRCENKHVDDIQCELWAMDNQCSQNPGFMMTNCYKACMGCTEDPKCENRLSDEYCEDANSRNQCALDPMYMYKWCWKTCMKCDGPVCENKHPSDAQCENWADGGECDRNAVFMNRNCSKSCTKCGKVSQYATECVNFASDANCTVWADEMDQCRLNPKWMIKNCRKSCSMCDRPWLRLNYLGNEPRPGSVSNISAFMSIILPGQFSQDGWLTHFNVFLATTDHVYLKIYTPHKNITGQYVESYFHRVVAPAPNTAMTVKVNQCIKVGKGDRVGFSSVHNKPVPIAVDKTKESLNSYSLRNAIVHYIPGVWGYPYKFSLSAAWKYPEDDRRGCGP